MLLGKLDADRPIAVIPDQCNGFAKGACGRIDWGGKLVGYLGQIDRPIIEKLSLRENVAAVELELEELLAGAQLVPQQHPLPRFPAVRRDLSLVVAESVRFEQIEKLMRSLNLADLEDLEYVTTYRGKPLDKDTKSVTITLVFRSASTTLTSEGVEESVKKAVEAAKKELGATLRA